MPASLQLRLDGRFFRRGADRVFLKAVTYGPFPTDDPLDPRDEFPRIAAAGFNAIRLYEPPDRHLLDAAADHGLSVLASIPWPWTRDFLRDASHLTGAELAYAGFLETHQHHPALGAILVANEIPAELVRWMGPGRVRDAIEHLISACRTCAPHLLFAYANYPSTEYLEPRNADFTAFNIYLEDAVPLHRYLQRLQNIAGDRPVLVTEFGLDTERHPEQEQADLLTAQLTQCLEAGIAGTTFFAWSDRWQNNGRAIDDWSFGLTRRDGSAKPSLAALGKLQNATHTHRDALPLENPPKFSVVVCSHNGAELLKTCLPACLAIDYPDFEVLVVDDGSSDATAHVVDGFPGVRLIQQEHLGLSVARNRGAEEATGDFIAYTDDDCEPDRDWLFWLARAFADPTVGAAGGPNIPPKPRGLQEAVIAAAPGAPSHVLLNDTRAEHLPGCNLAIRRSAFQRIRGFRQQFRTAGDDVDLCWRLLDANWQLAFAPAAFVWHRRRTSFPCYLKQQYGYGHAEALLCDAHPDRFSISGIRWEGCIYAGGPVSAGEEDLIDHGPLGAAPYQSIATHVLPRRPLAPRFDGPAAQTLLRLAEWLSPRLRSWNRWRKGGPPPFLRTPSAPSHIYRDDVRDIAELSFIGSDPNARQRFLATLQQHGWSPRPGTEAWDLELRPFLLLSALETHGGGYYVLRVRFLHPPGQRQHLAELLRAAATDADLHST